ncbi:hypothetical protein [Chrysiogenes arsenatis]|nr:hypothetical protein [Chrysiogenes arsenatis]
MLRVEVNTEEVKDLLRQLDNIGGNLRPAHTRATWRDIPHVK